MIGNSSMTRMMAKLAGPLLVLLLPGFVPPRLAGQDLWEHFLARHLQYRGTAAWCVGRHPANEKSKRITIDADCWWARSDPNIAPHGGTQFSKSLERCITRRGGLHMSKKDSSDPAVSTPFLASANEQQGSSLGWRLFSHWAEEEATN